MKKLILLLAILIGVTTLSGCQKDKSYSNYSVGANNWSGANDAIYEKAASYLISSGFVDQFQKEGGTSAEEHDAEAVIFFDGKLKQLTTTGVSELATKLKGSDGAPFTLSFDYLINRSAGDRWALVKTSRVSVKVEK